MAGAFINEWTKVEVGAQFSRITIEPRLLDLLVNSGGVVVLPTTLLRRQHDDVAAQFAVVDGGGEGAVVDFPKR